MTETNHLMMGVSFAQEVIVCMSSNVVVFKTPETVIEKVEKLKLHQRK